METLLVVCVVLLMVAVGFVTVYLVQTLEQVKRTTRSVEILTDKLNREVDKVQKVTDAASSVAGAFGGTLGKSATLAFSVISNFLKNREKARTSDGSEDVERPTDRTA